MAKKGVISMLEDLATIINTSLALLILLIATRVMGRRSVAQLTYFDYVIGITIGSIAASMAVSQVSVHQGAVSLGVSTLWVLLISVLTRYNLLARKLIDATPIIVIYKGQMLEANLQKNHYNVNDILEQLREQGIFDPKQVEVAIAETDGRLSVLKQPQFQPVIAKDLNISNNSSNPTVAEFIGKELVISGKVIENNLNECGITIEWLMNQLQSQGVNKVEDVTLAMLTPQNTLYIDKKNDTTPPRGYR